ncbi:MAG: hypothetical protein FWE57_02840, partial [Chitinispirillia bacterium]|nr:hypothetical protein [Chitinispirillia bacterium]
KKDLNNFFFKNPFFRFGIIKAFFKVGRYKWVKGCAALHFKKKSFPPPPPLYESAQLYQVIVNDLSHYGGSMGKRSW